MINLTSEGRVSGFGFRNFDSGIEVEPQSCSVIELDFGSVSVARVNAVAQVHHGFRLWVFGFGVAVAHVGRAHDLNERADGNLHQIPFALWSGWRGWLSWL